MLEVSVRGSSKKHKIRIVKTNTGVNHSITITKVAAERFNDRFLHETVLSDGILLTSGCGHIVEKVIKR